MGVALVTKHVAKKSHSLHGKMYLSSCTLLTRWSASVLKVGVPCGLQKDWPIVEFRLKTTLCYFRKFYH